jgi:hypothetical protein
MVNSEILERELRRIEAQSGCWNHPPFSGQALPTHLVDLHEILYSLRLIAVTACNEYNALRRIVPWEP